MEQPSSIKFGILMMLIGWIQGYDLTCPGLGHWNFRRTLICKEINNYTCIYDDVNQSIIENCEGPVPLGKGFKAIHRGNIDRKSCIDARYQPFSFSTAWYSKCVFLKSVCSEEGQVTVGKGITTEDRICGCDYQNMYAFIVKPSHLDNCKPMEEDCSCYKHLCPEEQLYLSKDYKCVKERGYYTTVNPDTAMSGIKVVSKDSIQKDDSRNGDRNNIYRYTISALSAGVIVYIGFLTYFLFTRHLGSGSRNKSDEELKVRFSPQSGYWSGPFILYGKTHGFKFILKCKNGIIKGRGVDNIDACKIRGKWNSNDGRVKFIKHYNDEKNYKVNYSGKLSPDSRTMSGQYNVETRSGTFTMSLSPSDENL